jgi:hypothetical protein
MLNRIKILTRGLLNASEVLRQMRAFWRGYTTWRYSNPWVTSSDGIVAPEQSNPLRLFFDTHTAGPGIWKWRHYFDIYHRHLGRFRGRTVRVLEIGIYSGGGLEMWRNYFGPSSKIYGIDIEPACKAYENDSVKVFIGDQGDRDFWRKFKQEVEDIDIVIDDGGHLPEQQIVTFEELLPHLRPGGVYICEDIHCTLNPFAAYMYGSAQNLNPCDRGQENADNNERRSVYRASPFQSAVGSIHLYPFMTVVERTEAPISELVSTKHGTQWQPFLR